MIMSKYKSQGLKNTFRNARKGFRLVLKSERNIRIHLVVASLVIATTFNRILRGMQHNRIKYHQAIVNQLDNTKSSHSAMDSDFEAKIKQLEQNKNNNNDDNKNN